MITLALDTSTTTPCVALVRDDQPIAELWLGDEAGAGRRVLEAIHGTLAAVGRRPNDIGRIVVGVGPGGFTGLRIGLATALGLGQALGVEVVGASSLEALAHGAVEARPGSDVVVPVLDARRRELFAAAYRRGPEGAMEQLIAPCAIPADQLASRMDATAPSWAVVGPGVRAGADTWLAAGAVVPAPGWPGHRLAAAALVARVSAGAGCPAMPHYARLPDAEINRRAAAAAGA